MARTILVTAVLVTVAVWQHVAAQGGYGGQGDQGGYGSPGGYGGHGDQGGYGSQGGYGGHGDQGGYGSQGGQESYGGHGQAQSSVHFTGPVEGHDSPVVLQDKHGHKIIDYVANPKYHYVYDIADHHTGDIHNQKESHDGHQVQGEYSLKGPSGGQRSVKYLSDKDGFHAEVHIEKISHPTGHKSYGGGHGGY